MKDDVVRSLSLFLAHKTFAAEMGGTARRGLLFEGQPGTGKTYLAKAMAREAGVPFLFVSATSFQSMYYGATARKIRSYFKALRKAARQEGGAIGFIEEIDAIAMARGGLSMTAHPSPARSSASTGSCAAAASRGCRRRYAPPPCSAARRHRSSNRSIISEGVGGVVNELLVQLQSFDDPTGLAEAPAPGSSTRSTCYLPAAPPAAAARARRRRTCWSSRRRTAPTTSTRRCCAPAGSTAGSRSSRPTKAGRRELVDFFLARKAHDPELDEDDGRATRLAAVTQGYTPVMIEHLFDEALVNALRRGEHAMDRARRRAGPAGRGGGHGPARRLHRARAAADRDARGRATP